MTATLTTAERLEYDDVLTELERRADAAQPDFGAWLTRNRPEIDGKPVRWDYRHTIYMQQQFDRITSGEISHLALGISGRHGKTELMMSYAAYILDRDPTANVLFCTYNDTQARKVGRLIRLIGNEVGLAIVGPKPSDTLWYVEGGGSLQCIGANQGSASMNPTHILIDDPIGKRAEAESFAHRDRVWLMLSTDLLARMVARDEAHGLDGTRAVFSMPRWHTDDPFGRLLDQQADLGTFVDMPGRALPDDQLGRAEGELLWPELRGEEFHRQQRVSGGAYGYASFIQCRPTPREGGMFKWDWWKLLDDIPAAGQMVRYWDLAGTQPKGGKHDPDYSVGVLGCRMEDKCTAIVDVSRVRLSVAARDAHVKQVAVDDLENYGRRVSWWIETETGIAGADRTAQLVRNLQNCGITVRTEHPTGSKIDRAEPLAGAAEAGNVLLCPGAWRDPFRLEMADAPFGSHDDQMDAAAGMFTKLANRMATRLRKYHL